MKFDFSDLKRMMILRLSRGNSSRGRGRNGRGRGRGTGSRDNFQQAAIKKDVECYYCHKIGHIKAECYKKRD